MRIDELKKLTGVDISRMSLETIKPILKDAIQKAKSRQTNQENWLKNYNYEDIATPRSFSGFGQPSLKGKWAIKENVTNYRNYDFSIDTSIEFTNQTEKLNYYKYKLSRAIDYLNTKTSTRKGFEQQLKSFAKTIDNYVDLGNEGKQGYNWDKKTNIYNSGVYKRLWDIYNFVENLSKNNPEVNWGSLSSQKKVVMVLDEMKKHPRMKADNLARLITKTLNKKYEEERIKYKDDDTEDVFGLEGGV